MTTGIFYNKQTGSPVQIIARAQTKPTFQEVVCYQELTKPYDYYVMERHQFFAEYVRDFAELPLARRKQLEKRADLPDKRPRISKGEVDTGVTDSETTDRTLREPSLCSEKADTGDTDSEEKLFAEHPELRKLVEFFDADTYREKLRLFEKMRTNLTHKMIQNIAVSLDLPLDDDKDMIRLIESELKIRGKYEGQMR